MAAGPAGLLAIYAHPDDETFGVGGTMALLAEAGERVSLICTTNGDEGGAGDESGDFSMDPAIRMDELRCACRALGIDEPVFLGYRDSGMENRTPKEGAFVLADRDEVIGRLLDAIRRLRPAVVVTFDPGGIYGHPDHVRVSELASEAFRRAHMEADGPLALYHQALPRSFAEKMIAEWESNDRVPDARAPTEEDLIQRRRFIELARPDADLTTTIDVRSALARKQAAFRCHASQFRPDQLDDAEDTERMEAEWGVELFIRVVPAPEPGERETWLLGLAAPAGLEDAAARS